MAAFFQNLFKKRSTTATTADSSQKKAGNQREATGIDEPMSRGPEQSDIDAQREVLATPGVTQQTLADLAVMGLAADVRLEAARGLTDEALLHQVQKSARGRDKGVYQHARQVLQELRREKEQELATQEALEQLAREAGELAKTGDTSLYEARTRKLEQQWHALEPSADNEQRTRILAALHTCRQRVADLEAERQEEQRHKAQQVQREETLSLLRETLDAFASEAPSPGALPSLDALQRTQENRWLEATRDTEVARQEQKQYEQLMLTLRSTVNAVRRLANHQAEIDALAGESAPSVEQIQNLVAELEWPEQIAMPTDIQGLIKKARGSQVPAANSTPGDDTQEKLAAKLDSSIERLESALGANQLKEARQHLKQAQGLQRQLSGTLAKRHQGRLQRLAGQVRELGDWRGFATEPKQQALCEQMEYLAEQPMDPEAKAARIQELQQEWRELGGSSNRDLWQRFRTASEAAFEPCKAYFEARSDLKKVHLQKRYSICEELGRYLESTNWSQVDWKAAEQIERTARKEWREAWPVEFRENRPIQKTFDRLMNDLSAHLDEERRRNEERKQSIVERARELIDHSPLAEAMEEAKALQKQWQDIGITRHREDRRLWKSFRAACDDIFARRDEQRQRRQQEANESDEMATAIIARAQPLLDESSADDRQLQEMIAELRAASSSPVSAGVARNLRDMVDQLASERQARQLRASVRQWQQWIDLRHTGALATEQLPQHWAELKDDMAITDPRELVVLAEILSGRPSPDDDQPLRMEVQVRRLKEGFAGGQPQADHSGDTLEALVARWCLSLPQSELTPELSDRFKQALDPGNPA